MKKYTDLYSKANSRKRIKGGTGSSQSNKRPFSMENVHETSQKVARPSNFVVPHSIRNRIMRILNIIHVMDDDHHIQHNVQSDTVIKTQTKSLIKSLTDELILFASSISNKKDYESLMTEIISIPIRNDYKTKRMTKALLYQNKLELLKLAREHGWPWIEDDKADIDTKIMESSDISGCESILWAFNLGGLPHNEYFICALLHNFTMENKNKIKETLETLHNRTNHQWIKSFFWYLFNGQFVDNNLHDIRKLGIAGDKEEAEAELLRLRSERAKMIVDAGYPIKYLHNDISRLADQQIQAKTHDSSYDHEQFSNGEFGAIRYVVEKHKVQLSENFMYSLCYFHDDNSIERLHWAKKHSCPIGINPLKYVVKGFTEAMKFVSRVDEPGPNDRDYYKHYYVNCVLNFMKAFLDLYPQFRQNYRNCLQKDIWMKLADKIFQEQALLEPIDD